MLVTSFRSRHLTHCQGIGGALSDTSGCRLYIFIGHLGGHRAKNESQLMALVRRYDQCRSSELIGGLRQLRQGRGLHLDAVGCGDGEMDGECHEEVAGIDIVVELLVEGGECWLIHRRRRKGEVR